MSFSSSGHSEPNYSTPIDEWFSPFRFATLLALLIIILFPDVIFGSHTFIFRDFGIFGYPMAFYHRESFWRGEIPLWNPLNCSGLPFLAQWNTLVCYPLSLVYLLFPLSWSLAIFCLLHQFLAGMTMYFLAYRWTSNRFAAAVAGLAYAFNGLTLNSLMWPNNIAALAWMPLVVLTVERAWREGGKRGFIAALVGAMQMLSGAPEIILFTWAIVFVLGAAQWLQEENFRLRLPGRFGAVVLLVIGLASVQLLPFLDLLVHSERGVRYGGTGWSMPAWGWANFLVPLFRCTQTPSGIYFQPNQGWTSSYYLGIGIFALGCLAVWKSRDKRMWLLAGLALLSLVLALGDSGLLLAIIRRVFPQIGFLRYPIKCVVIAVFAVPLLAAYAVQHYFPAEADSEKKFRRDATIVALFFLGIVSALFAVTYFRPAEHESWKTTFLSGISRLVFLAFIVACGGLILQANQSKRALVLRIALLLLFWLDVATHAPSPNPRADRSVYEPNLPMFQALNPKPIPGESRLALSFDSLAAHQNIGADPAKGFLANRLALANNCNIFENIPKVDGFFSLHLKEEREVHYRIYTSTNTLHPHLADFLGICQVTSERNFFEWQPRPTFLPLITAGQKPLFVDEQTSLRGLFDPNFDPSRTVFLPLEAQSSVTVTNGSRPRISLLDFSPQRITFTVEATEPAMVVIAQAYYHPWKASVNSAPVPLLRANHAFQALEIPAGVRRVRLVYEDRSFRYGSMISGATLLGCFAGLFTFRRKK